MTPFVRYVRLLVAVSFVIFSGVAYAQGRGPGGIPPGQRGPGPDGPGGPGGNQPPGSGAASGNGGGAFGMSRNSLQIGPAGRWWDDKSVVRSVGLRGEQQKKMDTIFDANKPAILASYKVLLAEQDKLSVLNKSAHPDQAAVFAQIDAVSQSRAALQKATAQMLLQIRQQMDTGQMQKLQQIH